MLVIRALVLVKCVMITRYHSECATTLQHLDSFNVSGSNGLLPVRTVASNSHEILAFQRKRVDWFGVTWGPNGFYAGGS